ncbi:MAG: PAS domain S-box protein [Leptospira sp.]|nr:PAS domain S-box protein [Leptospira sp.]
MSLLPPKDMLSDLNIDLLNRCMIGLVSFSDEGVLISLNAAFLSLTGFDKKDVLNEQLFLTQLFIESKHKEKFDTLISSKIETIIDSKTLTSPTLNIKINTKTGESKYFYLTIVKYPNQIFYVFVDITEQHKTKDQLSEREHTLRLFVENSPAALAMLDTNLRYMVVSKRWYTDYQLTEADVIGKRHYDIFPDLPDRWKEIHSWCLKGNVQKSDEDFFIRDNGETVWLKWEIQPWYLVNGKVGGLIFLTDVITKFKLAQQAVEKSEANFRTIFQATDTAYILLDKDLRVILFNSLAEKYSKFLFNHNPKIGDKIIEHVLAERKKALSDNLNKVLGGEKLEYNVNLNLPDGKEIWIQNRFLPILNHDGSILGVMLSTRDITDQKLEEIQRNRLTSDIIQHNKELEQFAYIVSHNLRAPVTNIISIVNALGDASLPEEDKLQFQSYLLESANKLDEILKDLNYVLRGKHDYAERRENINLYEVIEEIKDQLSDAIKKTGVTFIVDLNAISALKIVRGRLYTILINLISNSIKFRDASRNLEVKIVTSLEDQFILITITDNGTGIDLSQYGNQIFGLYKRFHQSTEGKGLGLYLVKSLVESLGGRINLRSQPKQGTEITLRFPRHVLE